MKGNIMLHTPYLIQRVRLRKGNIGKTIDGVFVMDYMGSAEFEFGALPKSLKEICRNFVDYHSTKSPSIVSKNNESLWLFSNFSEEDEKKYFEYIQQMIDEKLFLKEDPYLKYHTRHILNKQYHYTPSPLPDVWWDIDNHLMFTFGNENLRTILTAIEWTIQKKVDEKAEGWYRK